MYVTSENIINMARKMFAKRSADVNKSSFGRAVIFGSSRDFVGAVKLSALGELSMRMGTGYSVVAVPDEIVSTIAPNIFECVVAPQKSENGKFVFCEKTATKTIQNASSVAIGMGMGKSVEVQKLISFIFQNFSGNVIIDADGLNSIDLSILEKPRKCNLVLTPHVKEFSRLSNKSVEKIKSDAENIAKNFASEYNLTLVLKDFQTIITNGEDTSKIEHGSPSLAKAGSGDFLAGAISGLSANFEIFNSAVVASSIIASASSEFSSQYNDNIMLSRDLFRMVADFIKTL